MTTRDSTPEEQQYARDRRDMVEFQLRRRGIRDERVLQAMLRIPRHEFISGESRSLAYADHPLPIGESQTISQPFIIAVSLQGLSLTGAESALEIGTGSGYQTALLALLARHVYTIERHPTLAHSAETILARLGLNNVKVLVGDGSQGLRQFAPFDAILVSAAAPRVPPSLLEQLSDNGTMVVPVGDPDAQELQLVRNQSGKTVVQILEGCRFVPLIGAEGY